MVSKKDMTIEELMLQALEISRQALPHCRPNPPVGCIITLNRQIVSKGYTEAPGQRHAEIMALDNCSENVGECELFVTLEPCSFFGRTPACTDSLIRYRPKKIFVSLLDSDTRNNGRGISLLRDAGLDVETGVAAVQVGEFLSQYLIRN